MEFEYHPDCFIALPCLALVRGEHEKTGEPGGLMIQAGFLFWTVFLYLGVERE